MKLGETIGGRVRQERESRGLTQYQLAQSAESEPSYIGRLERGEIDNPGLESVVKILNVLGIKLDEIIGTAKSGQAEVA